MLADQSDPATEAAYDKAIAAYDAVADARGQVRARVYLATYRSIHGLDRAIESLGEAERIAAASGDLELVALVTVEQAWAAYRAADYGRAARLLERVESHGQGPRRGRPADEMAVVPRRCPVGAWRLRSCPCHLPAGTGAGAPGREHVRRGDRAEQPGAAVEGCRACGLRPRGRVAGATLRERAGRGHGPDDARKLAAGPRRASRTPPGPRRGQARRRSRGNEPGLAHDREPAAPDRPGRRHVGHRASHRGVADERRPQRTRAQPRHPVDHALGGGAARAGADRIARGARRGRGPAQPPARAPRQGPTIRPMARGLLPRCRAPARRSPSRARHSTVTPRPRRRLPHHRTPACPAAARPARRVASGDARERRRGVARAAPGRARTHQPGESHAGQSGPVGRCAPAVAGQPRGGRA